MRKASGLFREAAAAWPKGREREVNLTVGFRAEFRETGSERTTLRVTGSSFYRAFVNGEFVGHGPARAGHGIYRVDEWEIAERLGRGSNVVAIEVAGYNANGYGLLDQPSFVQAEVVADGRVLAATGDRRKGFAAFVLDERVQKIDRYSWQRSFAEYYRLGAGWNAWRRKGTARRRAVACTRQETKTVIERGVPYPAFATFGPNVLAGAGKVLRVPLAEKPWKNRGLNAVGPNYRGYAESELDVDLAMELQRFESKPGPPPKWRSGEMLKLKKAAYRILDFSRNRTGFLRLKVRCWRKTRLFVTFDELLQPNGDIEWRRLGCTNAVGYELAPGKYELETFEPYELRFLKVMVTEGEAEIEEASVRELAYGGAWGAQFAASDEKLNRLFDAGRETFRQNTVDIFMDCPSRERAGWLCDSYFTARVAKDLCGEARVERNFLGNYLHTSKYPCLPAGMLPMCYPAEHRDGNFIANWAMWLVLQLEEYALRSGDRETVKGFAGRVSGLMRFMAKYENKDGLLENLPKWVFVEWSKANEFTQDVNYPSNMLYAGALSAAGRLYGRKDLLRKAERVRQAVRWQSFDGKFFVDNAVREKGRLKVTRNRTEACQYYAFYFGVATPETHPKLWKTVTGRFGPDRVAKGDLPDIYPANAFIGNALRLELLSRAGLSRKIVEESAGYLLHMARETGTLWENQTSTASCNHGFFSHICHTLYRDVLGVQELDTVGRRVNVRFTDTGLEWCEGRMPVPTGAIEVNWRRTGRTLRYRVSAPEGYVVTIDNRTGLRAVDEAEVTGRL